MVYSHPDYIIFTAPHLEQSLNGGPKGVSIFMRHMLADELITEESTDDSNYIIIISHS